MAELYHPEVKPFIHSNEALDRAISRLWNLCSRERINLAEAGMIFQDIVGLAVGIGNIRSHETYVPHCLLVSAKCEEFGSIIQSDYPFLALDPKRLGFAGLIEDSMYLVGGNGRNNSNGEDSNPFHEILTYIEMSHRGYPEFADGMALHFVAPQILREEQKRGRFSGVRYKRTPTLDILTSIDALCTTEWLPDKHKGSMPDALEARIKGVVESRKDPNHPLVIGINNGGREHLHKTVKRLNRLIGRDCGVREVKDIYGIPYLYSPL